MAQDPQIAGVMDKFQKAQQDNNYNQQAAFFLNAFWAELGEDEAPTFWDYAQKMNELDEQDGDEGHSLDFGKSLSVSVIFFFNLLA